MSVQNFRHSLFPVSLFAFFISLVAIPTANAVSISRNLTWTGDSGNTLTGTFTGEDVDLDGIIQAVSPSLNSGIGINEFSVLSVTLTESSGTLSFIYDRDQLLGFNTLNFNYDIASGTVLQSLNPTDLLQGTFPNFDAGLSIGDSSSGFVLESMGLIFTDNASGTFIYNDNGGTLEATPVPYEFEMASGVLAFGVWLSRKKVMAKIKSWRSKG